MGQADNIRDRDKRGRSRKSDGDYNPLARLTERDIPEIRRRLAAGEPQYAIAKDYDVARAQIGYIKRGKTWKHV